MPLDRGGKLGDLTNISSTNGSMRAVEGTEKGNELHVDLTRHCGISTLTANAVLHCV